MNKIKCNIKKMLTILGMGCVLATSNSCTKTSPEVMTPDTSRVDELISEDITPVEEQTIGEPANTEVIVDEPTSEDIVKEETLDYLNNNCSKYTDYVSRESFSDAEIEDINTYNQKSYSLVSDIIDYVTTTYNKKALFDIANKEGEIYVSTPNYLVTISQNYINSYILYDGTIVAFAYFDEGDYSEPYPGLDYLKANDASELNGFISGVYASSMREGTPDYENYATRVERAISKEKIKELNIPIYENNDVSKRLIAE